MNKAKSALIGLLVLVLGLLTGNQVANLGGAGEAQGKLATTSTVAIGPKSVIRAFPSSACSARVIQTKGEGLYVAFSSGTRGELFTDGNGFFQAASTSKDYDAKTFGCEDWWVRPDGAANASSSITVKEF